MKILLCIALSYPCLLMASNYPPPPGPWGETISFDYIVEASPEKTIEATIADPTVNQEKVPQTETAVSPTPVASPKEDVKFTLPPKQSLTTDKAVSSDPSEITPINPTELPSSDELEHSLPSVIATQVIPLSNETIAPTPQKPVSSEARQVIIPPTYSPNRSRYPNANNTRRPYSQPRVNYYPPTTRYPSEPYYYGYQQGYSQNRNYQPQPYYPKRQAAVNQANKPKIQSLYQSFEEEQVFPDSISK